MRTATTIMTMVVVVMLMVGVTAGGWRKRGWHRRRRCHHAAGEGVMAERAGDHYLWTMTGLDEDDLRVTYHTAAFAPEGSAVVFMYPRDRRQWALGLMPAHLFYDFSDPAQPVTVIRKGRRGRGLCLVIRNSDVSSYDDMLTELLARNVTNREVVEEEEARRMVVEQTTDLSGFSEVLRDLCSQDLCGNPLDTVYFTAVEEDVTEEEEELLEEAEEMDPALSNHSFMLFNDRVTLSGFPSRRQWRHSMGSRQDRVAARQERRQQRRLGRKSARRQQRRQQRRQFRRQRRPEREEIVHSLN